MVKSERKNRKNQKKKIKVIETEFTELKNTITDPDNYRNLAENFLNVPDIGKSSRKNSDNSGDKSNND